MSQSRTILRAAPVLAALLLLTACDKGDAPATPDAPKTGEAKAGAKATDPAAKAVDKAADKAMKAAEPAKAADPAAKAADPAAKAADKAPAKPVAKLAPASAADLPGKKVDGTITFATKAPKVGATLEETTTSDMNMTLKLGMMGQVKDMSSAEKSREKRTVTVKATKDNALTKVEVTYTEKNRQASDQGKQKQSEDAPVTGKTYLVTANGDKVEVVSKDGKEVPELEANIVRSDFNALGKPDRFAALLPKTAMKVGDKIDLSKEALSELMNVGAAEKANFEDFVFTLKEVREIDGKRAGLFELSLKMKVAPGPGMAIAMKLGGFVLLFEDGTLANFIMQGPVTVEVDEALKAQVTAEGGGNVKFSKQVSYR